MKQFVPISLSFLAASNILLMWVGAGRLLMITHENDEKWCKPKHAMKMTQMIDYDRLLATLIIISHYHIDP
jgi:hypothetical protein